LGIEPKKINGGDVKDLQGVLNANVPLSVSGPPLSVCYKFDLFVAREKKK
jgi:hypothetical protein